LALTLRIGLMSPWNSPCGVAVHAWLIGRSWIEAGHELFVFAPIKEVPGDMVLLDAPDESFVIRCWEMHRHGDRLEDDAPLGLQLEPGPLMKAQLDVLFVEKPCSTPLSKLVGMVKALGKRGCRVAAIMHEGVVPRSKHFYQIEWDFASLFDERFFALYGQLIRAKKVAIVPYPFHPIREGDVAGAREALGLPHDAEIVLAFGTRAEFLWPIMPYLASIARRRPLKLLILAKHGKGLKHALALKNRYNFVLVRREAPHYEALYDYLHACNVVLLHRPHRHDYIPLSSTVHLCLGALRPILCPDNNFFEPYDGAVLKYSGPGDLVRKLELALDGGPEVSHVLQRARELIAASSADKVAERLLRLALS